MFNYTKANTISKYIDIYSISKTVVFHFQNEKFSKSAMVSMTYP